LVQAVQSVQAVQNVWNDLKIATPTRDRWSSPR
jgi:hypothetical protein